MLPEPWTLDPGPWTLDPGPWTLDPGPWTLYPGPCTLDPGPSTLNAHPKAGNRESQARRPVLISGNDIKILFSKVDSPLKTSHFWRVWDLTRQKWLVFKG
ncbi:hypothetical protein T484DRAFT_2913013 [Baffinella frigidus]|nr:hypothetical protein T484DRAFT_2913013 [Cryptophyta sp. CCMP2293]